MTKNKKGIYVKYKNQKKISVLKFSEIFKDDKYLIDEEIEEVIFENCYIEGVFLIEAMDENTKIIIRDCHFGELYIEKGKSYLTNVDVDKLEVMCAKRFTSKGRNTIRETTVISEKSFVSGEIRATHIVIDSNDIIIDNSSLLTFFDLSLSGKKLIINNSYFKACYLSLDYEKSLVTETCFDSVYVFKVNGEDYKVDEKPIRIFSDDPNREENLKNYYLLSLLRNINNRVKEVNKLDYNETMVKIGEEIKDKILEQKKEITAYEKLIEEHQEEIKRLENSRYIKEKEQQRVFSKKIIGNIKGLKKEQNNSDKI